MHYKSISINPEELERFARKHPRVYKLRVGLLAILGYAYIVLILGIFGGAIIFLLALMVYRHSSNDVLIRLLIVLLIPIFLILRSLWDALTFKLPLPSGISLKRQTTPNLFQLLDQLTNSLKSSSFSQVILTSEFNATVLQMPRFGILGGSQNYLMIGLPLLQSLDVEQCRAVLAHELGHLSGNHSRFAGWVYRIRQTWTLILDRFSGDNQKGESFLFTPFLRWYILFFNAYSFVLARADEYEADQCALELAGPTATASALIYTNLKAKAEATFWQNLYQQVAQMSEPPSQPFTHLAHILQTPLEPRQQQQWLEQILAVQTDSSDTHPCLSDRLTALNISLEDIPCFLTPLTQTAAVELLGDALPALIEQFNQNWQTSITFQWKEQYQKYQQIKHRLEILDAKAVSYPLALEEAWEQAQLTAQIKTESTESEVISLLQLILFRKPAHAGANYLLGEILIQKNDIKGIQYLEKAMENNADTIIAGCQLIEHFWSLKGEKTQALKYRKKLEAHQEELALAQQERSQFRRSDRFCVPHLPSNVLLSLRQQLAQYPEITTVYLAQRIVKYLPQKPCLILGIQRIRKGDSDEELLNRLAKTLDCPSYTIIVLLNGSNRWLGQTLKRTVEEPLYQVSKRDSKV